jgi:predicted nucleotidyltransferase component of viral defense system
MESDRARIPPSAAGRTRVKQFPDRRYFSRVATDSGFRTRPLETVFRLAGLLHGLGSELGEELSLRGGTALNLLHLDIPRLSVDIDLDFVGTPDAEDARRRRPEVVSRIEDLGRSFGYDVVPERASYAMAHVRMHYTDANGRPAFLKVDVNFLDRVPVLPPETRPLRHPFGDDLPDIDVLTVQLPELVAGKSIALVRRALARDLFDVSMLHGRSDWDMQTARTILLVRGAAYPPPSPAAYSTEAVDRVRYTDWRSEVQALARRPMPIALEDARDRGRDLLSALLEIDEGHLQFLHHLEEGEIRPEVLPMPELHDRISMNPGLHWRIRVGAQQLEER